MSSTHTGRVRLGDYREFRPSEYETILDKDTFFAELGESAAAQFATVYRRLRNPNLDEDDRMAWMLAEETVRELVSPGPEAGREEGWESVEVTDEEYQRITATTRQDRPTSDRSTPDTATPNTVPPDS